MEYMLLASGQVGSIRESSNCQWPTVFIEIKGEACKLLVILYDKKNEGT